MLWPPMRVTLFVICAIFILQFMPLDVLYAQEHPPVDELVKPSADDLSSFKNVDTAKPLGFLRDGRSHSDLERWSKIVYQSARTGNWDIYVTNGAGNQVTAVAPHPAVDAHPRLTRGAERVVFDSTRSGNGDIYAVNSDGSGLVRLTDSPSRDYSPAWSPDGQRVAFVSHRAGNDEIYVMNADGSEPTRLTYNGAVDSSPVWSPDGNSIAWKRLNGTSGTVWIMNADGSNQQVWVANLRYLGDLSWAPAGDKLISDADIDGDFWNELIWLCRGSTQICWSLDAATSFVDLWAGSYAPDGESVVFSLLQYRVVGNRLEIERADLGVHENGSQQPYRLPGSGADLNPNWDTADLLAPTSQLLPLPAFVPAGRFPVRWRGVDLGPAGVETFDIQYRVQPDTAWQNWQTALSAAVAKVDFLAGAAGDMIEFRIRARDYAGNVEPWPDEPATAAQLHRGLVSGAITDNRGVALAQATVTIDPASLTQPVIHREGAFHTWLVAAGSHTVTPAASGFGVRSPAILAPNLATVLDLSLPPLTDVLANGGFEAGLEGWETTGTIIEGGVTDAAYGGMRALRLGDDCVLPCIAEQVELPEDFVSLYGRSSASHLLAVTGDAPFSNSEDYFDITVDAAGDIHAVRQKDIDNDRGGILYIRRTPDGEFSESTLLINRFGGHSQRVVIDGVGTVHVMEMNSEGVHDTQRLPTGEWMPSRLVADCFLYDAIGARDGGLHLLCTSGRGHEYLRIARDGSVTGMPVTRSDEQVELVAFAVGADDVVHFLWSPGYTELYYFSLRSDGAFSPTERLHHGPSFISASFNPTLVVAASGEVHALWYSDRGLHYVTRSPEGQWRPNEALPGLPALDHAGVEIDDRGLIHVVAHGRKYGATGEIEYFWIYLFKTQTGWSTPLQPFLGDPAVDFAASAGGGLHFLLYRFSEAEFHYLSARVAEESSRHYAVQRVSINPEILNPTLAFDYRTVMAEPDGASTFSVMIADDITTTTVYTGSVTADWQHAWADLQPWSGRQVTVTFSIEQAAGERNLLVDLDNVSLGEWTTPYIEQVVPAQISVNWTGQTIEITGENFAPGTTLWLGERQLLNVTRVNEQTLVAQLPDGLPHGRYPLSVYSPNGKTSVRLLGLTLGATSFLPYLSNQQ